MKFIRKKNLIGGEELLYIPQLSWFYTVKHLVLALPFYAILLILWLNADSVSDVSLLGLETKMAVRYIFIVSLLIMLVIFVYRIFLYLSTEYGVTNKRLLFKKGIFRLFTAEIPMDRIESIYCIQGIFGMIFRYGTVCISGIGGKTPVFYMVCRPYAVRRKIVDIIEKNKAITVIHGELPMPQPEPKPEPKKEPEPAYRYGTFVRVMAH